MQETRQAKGPVHDEKSCDKKNIMRDVILM